MARAAATYEKILDMVIQTKNYTRKVLEEMPGVLMESSSNLASPASSRHRSPNPTPKPSLRPTNPPAPSASGSSSSGVSPTTSSSLVNVLGEIRNHRVYRSLSSKHVVVLQDVELQKPISDEEFAKLERQLEREKPSRKRSQTSVISRVPTDPKSAKHLHL